MLIDSLSSSVKFIHSVTTAKYIANFLHNLLVLHLIAPAEDAINSRKEIRRGREAGFQAIKVQQIWAGYVLLYYTVTLGCIRIVQSFFNKRYIINIGKIGLNTSKNITVR